MGVVAAAAAAAAVVAVAVVAAAAAVVDAAHRPMDEPGSSMGILNSCTSPEVFVVEAVRITGHADRDLAMKLPKQGNSTEGCDIQPDMDAAYVVQQPSAQNLLLTLNKGLSLMCRKDLGVDSSRYQGVVDRSGLDRPERRVIDAEAVNRE